MAKQTKPPTDEHLSAKLWKAADEVRKNIDAARLRVFWNKGAV